MAKFQATYRAGSKVPDATVDAMQQRMKEKDYSFSDLVNELWQENEAYRTGGAALADVAEVSCPMPAEFDTTALEQKITDMKQEILDAMQDLATPVSVSAPIAPAPAPMPASVEIPDNLYTTEQAEAASEHIVSEIIAAKEAQIARLDAMMKLLEQLMSKDTAAPAAPVPAAPMFAADVTVVNDEAASPATDAEVAIAHAASEEDDLASDAETHDVMEDTIIEEVVVDDMDDDDAPSNLSEEEADDLASMLANALWDEELEDLDNVYEAEEFVADAEAATPIMEELEIVEASMEAVATEQVTEEPSFDEAKTSKEAGDQASEEVDDDAIVFSDDELDDDALLGLEQILNL